MPGNGIANSNASVGSVKSNPGIVGNVIVGIAGIEGNPNPGIASSKLIVGNVIPGIVGSVKVGIVILGNPGNGIANSISNVGNEQATYLHL